METWSLRFYIRKIYKGYYGETVSSVERAADKNLWVEGSSPSLLLLSFGVLAEALTFSIKNERRKQSGKYQSIEETRN